MVSSFQLLVAQSGVRAFFGKARVNLLVWFLSQVALQRCNVNFLARFLGWILEGEFWEVNFSTVNFSGGLFSWKKIGPKNSTQEFGSKIRASKIRLAEFGPKFGFRRCKIPCAEICPWWFHSVNKRPNLFRKRRRRAPPGLWAVLTLDCLESLRLWSRLMWGEEGSFQQNLLTEDILQSRESRGFLILPCSGGF